MGQERGRNRGRNGAGNGAVSAGKSRPFCATNCPDHRQRGNDTHPARRQWTKNTAIRGDISTAGEHLLALIDDMTDPRWRRRAVTTAPDRIDLAGCRTGAVGILGVRAQEKGIGIDAPARGEKIPAIGEFRRVLQVLLKLLGNAIRYSPRRIGRVGENRVRGRFGPDCRGRSGRGLLGDSERGCSRNSSASAAAAATVLGVGLYISRRLRKQ